MRPRPVHSRKLSEELHALAVQFGQRAVTLQEVVATLGDRATGLMILLCSLPFLLPIPLPGLSQVLGLVVLLLSVGFLLGRPPWLPQWITRRSLPARFFPRLLEGCSKGIGWVERRLRPRAVWVCGTPLRQRLHTVTIIVSAFLLFLPLPPFPPATNWFPAVTIVIMTMSLIESDGVGVMVAYFFFLLTIVYFVLIALFGTLLAEWAYHYAQQSGLREWLPWLFPAPVGP